MRFFMFFFTCLGAAPIGASAGTFFFISLPKNRPFLCIKEFFACTQLISINVVNIIIDKYISGVSRPDINSTSGYVWVGDIV